VEVRFSSHVQMGSGAQLAFYTMGTGSFPGVKTASVRERIEIKYFFFASVTSWHVTG
jgi:hypothetical protein